MARVRSPNYPAISLRQAIDQASKIYSKEHTHKASPAVIAKAMGYGGLNGASLTAISSLKKYGLLEGVNSDLKISSDALTILVDPKESPERAKAIIHAAFKPALFNELQQQYGRTLPSDENLRAYLLKRGFNQQAVDTPIRAYRETIELVTESEKVYSKPQVESINDSESDDALNQIEVGDIVQWESNNVLQFEKPKRVRAIQQHEGNDWIFVDGSETGIPMNEAILEGRATPNQAIIPPTLSEMGNTSIKIAQTERELLRGPLSKGSSYRLIVLGDLGPKELKKLIKLLEAQCSVLIDDEEET